MHKFCLLLVTLGFFGLSVFGLFNSRAEAGSGFYAVDKSITPGMIVSLTKNAGVVEPANLSNASSVVGVVGSAPSDFDIQPDQIAVQSDGTVEVLVSTLNGDISAGDSIGVSSVNGIGSKLNGAGWSLGVAQAGFSSSSPDAVKTTVSQENSSPKEVSVGKISVVIRIMHQDAPADTAPAIDKVHELVNKLAGKQVPIVAIMVAALILLTGLMLGGLISYAAVRTGIQGVARQPLSKQAIMGRMVQSLVMALLIIGVAASVAFIIIKL